MTGEPAPKTGRDRDGRVVAAFSVAIFVAAALLFAVQPMVGRMVLPRLGGSPEVWNTSMVFYQAALLAGYLYAHYSVRWLGVRGQILLHGLVLLAPLVVLPLALPDWRPPAEGGQSLWLLGLLAVAVGAPFFALATASPLLQRWLAATRHEDADDPYFLYASSNAGSLVGLLAYPLVIEPTWALGVQSRGWSFGYFAFVGLVALCGVVTLRMYVGGAAHRAPAGRGGSDSETRAPPSAGDRLLWVACAFVPSSLFLGVTHFLTSDVAAFPLLWVAPLAVYLATYIAAFSRRDLISLPLVSRLLATGAVALALTFLAGIRQPSWAMVLLHLAVLAVAGLLCHGRLAERRPPTSHLTEFYVLVAGGGVLGGVFNALVAPQIFDRVLEYPVALVLALVLRMPFRDDGEEEAKSRMLDVAVPLALGVGLLAVHLALNRLPEMPAAVVVTATVALPGLVAFVVSRRPLRFALAVAVLFAFGFSSWYEEGELLHSERTFFGVHRVTLDADGRFIALLHGTTVHGIQATDPVRAAEPLGYYHSTGPAGQVMAGLAEDPDSARLALVGLGAGALAALTTPEQRMTAYEIDPLVVRIAENPEYFTYLEKSRAPYEVVLGDARVSLSESGARYDLMVLDAFSSSAVPVHLLTREALQLYLRRLTDDGVLLFHLSSRHLDLGPVLGALAADLGLAALERFDIRTDEEQARGLLSSRWVVMAREGRDLTPYVDGRWLPLRTPPDAEVWTDDYADIVSAYRWN